MSHSIRCWRRGPAGTILAAGGSGEWLCQGVGAAETDRLVARMGRSVALPPASRSVSEGLREMEEQEMGEAPVEQAGRQLAVPRQTPDGAASGPQYYAAPIRSD